jgi:hypothetical protein
LTSHTGATTPPKQTNTKTKQALEAFVSRAPAGARPSLDALLTAALGHLRHDPNFADDADVDGSGARCVVGLFAL